MLNETTSHYEVIEMLNTILEEKTLIPTGHCKRVAFIPLRLPIYSLSTKKHRQQRIMWDCYTISAKSSHPKPFYSNQKKTTGEFHVIQKHVIDSERIVESITPFKNYLPFIRHHHEHFNGAGYPDHKSERNSLISRILCIHRFL